MSKAKHVEKVKYDVDIDRAIINQLAESELLSTGKLKEKKWSLLGQSTIGHTLTTSQGW